MDKAKMIEINVLLGAPWTFDLIKYMLPVTTLIFPDLIFRPGERPNEFN